MNNAGIVDLTKQWRLDMRTLTKAEEELLNRINARRHESRFIDDDCESRSHYERKQNSDVMLSRMIKKFDGLTEWSSDIRTVINGATYADIRRFHYVVKNR